MVVSQPLTDIQLQIASSSGIELSAAQASQACAERYRAIADSSFDLICELDTEGRFVYLTPSFANSTGLDPLQLMGTSLFDRIPREEKNLLIAEYTAALAGTRVGRSSHRFMHANGDYRYLETVMRGLRIGDERRVMMVSRDVTAQQRHQTELETLITLAKTVHAQNNLLGIAQVTWELLRELLPMTSLLLAWRSEKEGVPALEVAGHWEQGPLHEIITRNSHPDCPLWEAYERTDVWLDNSWSGGMCGFEFPMRSFVAAPLRADDSVAGVMLFAASRPFVWTEEHVRLCLMATEQASVAVRGVALLKTALGAENRYRDLVNDVDAIVWEADLQSLKPTFVSEQVQNWLGYSAEEFQANPKLWLSLIPGEERRRVMEEMRARADQHEPWQIEFRSQTRDEREVWLRVLVTPEVQHDKVVRARGLTLDVTERRKTMDALLESNTILNATQEASADGICLVDEKGNVVSHNKRFAEMWHIPPALVEELRDRRQLMACVLSLMRQPEEFIERMNMLRQHPEDSSRDEITLRDGRVFERYSAPAHAGDGRSFGRVWTFSDITDRKKYEEQLAHRAFHDPLTDLPNRTLFMNRVEHALARLDRGDKSLAVLFFDLDRFKIVNDTMGHEKGDWLLQEVGRRLQAGLRPGDTAARFGGDEFTLLLEDLTGVEDAIAIVGRLASSLQAPVQFEGREFEITASIGVAMSSSAHDRAADLLRNADIAMYRAKNKGKARFEVFDTKMSAAALDRLQLEIELRQAVKWNQLRLCYQPLVDLDSERVIGMEALVRWQHPDRGLIAPSDFIPIAEESGMILPIGNWVLREACAQAKKWQLQFPELWPLKMSVNLSARQFQGADIVRDVANVLEDTGLDARCLELEITETAVMEDAEATIETLESLKKLGVKLAIDDFGTGYSSLAYIERFPLDALKIDRSFVAQIGKNGHNGHASQNKTAPKSKAKASERSVIMQAVQTLGQGLGMAITAEGIETPEQLAELRDMGCAVGQGFFWARPLDAVALSNLLREKSSAVAEAA